MKDNVNECNSGDKHRACTIQRVRSEEKSRSIKNYVNVPNKIF